MNTINQVKEFMQNAGIAWDVFVIVFCAITIVVWLDLFIGTRIRVSAKGSIGKFISKWVNFYILYKTITKAKGYHLITKKRYSVIPIEGKLYIVNNVRRKSWNRKLAKMHSVFNINDLLRIAIYHTK